ncbi:hypothetical protein DXB85_14260 [Parabacteroides merdae]|jgi:hypothetical protein|nr:hypothetical protein DXB85_14260 [Parabacteroides merdae]
MLPIESVAGYNLILTLMKRVIFYSRVQLILFICAVLMSATCFVGMFFNPFHVLTFVMSVILTIAIYKEKVGNY